MGNTLKTIAIIGIGIVSGFLGPGAFSATQFAIGLTVASMVLPVTPAQNESTKAPNSEGLKTTSIGTHQLEVYGKYERTGGDLMRVGLAPNGKRTGIEVVTSKKSSGGGGSPPKPKVTQSVEEMFVSASWGLCRGTTRIERIIELNSEDGQKVLYDANAPEGAGGIVFTDVIGSVSGTVIGKRSETINLWFGSEEQPVDSVEAGWYPGESVSADRGVCKVVFNRRLFPAGAQYKFLLVNDLTNRREIISTRLQRAGIPLSRINLRSIPDDAIDIGWFVAQKEPSRVLAEMVAAKSIHDLAFIVTEDGAAFTDISRSNPTYFVIEDWELGAVSVEGNGLPDMSHSGTSSRDDPDSGPREMSVSYVDYPTNFGDGYAKTIWPQATGAAQGVSFPCVGVLQEFQDFCDVLMCETHAARGTHAATLMPSRSQIAPGCVLIVPERSLTLTGGVKYLRVLNKPIRPDGTLECQCVPYDPAAYGRHKEVEQPTAPPPEVMIYAVPTVSFIDSIPLLDVFADAPTLLVTSGVTRTQSFGGLLLNAPGGEFDDVEMRFRATWGETLTDLELEVTDLYAFGDKTVRVFVQDGVLASTDEETVNHKRANLAWIGTNETQGVYISYLTAIPVVGLPQGTYDLSGITVFGVDWVNNLPTGSRFVQVKNSDGDILDSIESIILPIGRVGSTITCEGYVIRDETKTTGDLEINPIGNTLIPFPVEPSASVHSDGAGGFNVWAVAGSRYVESSSAWWVTGANWRDSDPQKYHVELLDGADVVGQKIVTPTVPHEIDVNFSAAEINAAYGSPQAAITVRIWQEGTYFDGRKRSVASV